MLSRHLHLNVSAQTLNVFCFQRFTQSTSQALKPLKRPFFVGICGPYLNSDTITNSNSSVLDGYYENYNLPAVFTTTELLKEVNLSYRLLFANEKQAQSAYRHRERKRSRKAMRGVTGPCLDALCGMEATNSYPMKLTYSAEDDFPIFTPRLLTLQAYMPSQSPNKINLL